MELHAFINGIFFHGLHDLHRVNRRRRGREQRARAGLHTRFYRLGILLGDLLKRYAVRAPSPKQFIEPCVISLISCNNQLSAFIQRGLTGQDLSQEQQSRILEAKSTDSFNKAVLAAYTVLAWQQGRDVETDTFREI